MLQVRMALRVACLALWVSHQVRGLTPFARNTITPAGKRSASVIAEQETAISINLKAIFDPGSL